MSVSNSMVGGTVADLFSPADRGFPMSLFTLSIFCGQVSCAIKFQLQGFLKPD